jgi:hypothetical protein
MTHMEVAGGYVKQIWLVLGWAKGMAGQNYCVADGCLLSLSLCRRGFQELLKVIIYLLAYEDGTDSVPKRRHIKFRRRGITQKKTYKI